MTDDAEASLSSMDSASSSDSSSSSASVTTPTQTPAAAASAAPASSSSSPSSSYLQSIKQLATLDDELFKYVSIAVYCELATHNGRVSALAANNGMSASSAAAAAAMLTSTFVDNTEAVTMLLLNNLVDLLELAASHEPHVWRLLASIHRNASASSLLIHSVGACWPRLCAKSRLYLLHACLRALEGVHLSASQHLVCLLMDKFIELPYLSLVRYADHIACQRIEMLQSLPGDELARQLAAASASTSTVGGGGVGDHYHLGKMFAVCETRLRSARTTGRHQRLISLLDQLRGSIEHASAGSADWSSMAGGDEAASKRLTSSASIDYFMLYVNKASSGAGLATNNNNSESINMDKEWFYNVVRSACCYVSELPRSTTELGMLLVNFGNISEYLF